MFGTQNLSLFVISGLLLNIAPGPDSVLVMTRSASQGFKAGSAAALGIGAGVFVHVAAAALGLSALLAASAWGFTLVKWVGAAYLVYMGLQLLFSRAETGLTAVDAQPKPLPWRALFAQGFLTNALNPKVALFFLAFVPQFIAPEAPNKALAFIALGVIFNIGGMLWCHALALFTARASQRIRLGGHVALWLNRVIGALFVSFGIKLALGGAR
jgi:RhtB (resistance to homoserine/threonine) family protein